MKKTNRVVLHFEVINNSDKKANAELFYPTKNLLKPNFGSDESIVVRTKEDRMFVDYDEFLTNALEANVEIESVVIIGEDYDKIKRLVVEYGDRNSLDGNWQRKEINIVELADKMLKSNFEAFQPNIHVENIDFSINKSSGFNMVLPPKSKFEFNFNMRKIC